MRARDLITEEDLQFLKRLLKGREAEAFIEYLALSMDYVKASLEISSCDSEDNAKLKNLVLSLIPPMRKEIKTHPDAYNSLITYVLMDGGPEDFDEAFQTVKEFILDFLYK